MSETKYPEMPCDDCGVDARSNHDPLCSDCEPFGSNWIPIRQPAPSFKINPDTSQKLIETVRAGLYHDVPGSCWSTGPLTGNAVEDLVVCPGCRALSALASLESALGDKTVLLAPCMDVMREYWLMGTDAAREKRLREIFSRYGYTIK
jgi:hypothetical protein